MADLMGASSRVAFVAFLHDLGKLTERAGIYSKHPDLEANQHHYCPYHRVGNRDWFSHKHAACTALALDDLEKCLPKLLSGDTFPFSARIKTASATSSNVDATDSLINAASMHHKPDTFLQWCIASADRIASGFEREEFEKYNKKQDRKDYIKAQLICTLESLFQSNMNEETDFTYRYPLASLSPSSLFPVKKSDRSTEAARDEYGILWKGLMEGIEKIPVSHRENWPLWIDHFDSLWMTYSHAIPSAAAFGVKPDVSLYDHSKTTAALATALWRYHNDLAHDQKKIAVKQKNRTDWEEEKFLLVQGDFFGIQDFIFSSKAESTRQAAKLLRGRSLSVSLMTECAALRVLDVLELPATSQVINVAGKFLIVAPNTPQTLDKIENLRIEFNRWFLANTLGLAGLGLVTTPASPNAFINKKAYKCLMEKLRRALDTAKMQRQNICGEAASPATLSVDYSLGACSFDPRFPANDKSQDNIQANSLSVDQINIGKLLAQRKNCARILIFRDTGSDLKLLSGQLKTSFFGYTLVIVTDQETSGDFGQFARNGQLRRAFDVSLPESENISTWAGYSRRTINGYVPVLRQNVNSDPRYSDIDNIETGDIKTFEHIARDSLRVGSDGDITSVSALGVLKGDVDDLGLVFHSALQAPTFAKWAGLSRRLNAFFSIWLPWVCQEDTRFQDIYTVFAGGDDFFMIGPWEAMQRLAWYMREEFNRYCAGNPDIHFSVGYVMIKPGHPLRLMTEKVEQALANAKGRNDGAKNSISIHGYVVPWLEWKKVLDAEETMKTLTDKYSLSVSYRYGLLQLSDMAENIKKRPENARWRSLLHYRTRRYVTDKMKSVPDERKEEIHAELVTQIDRHDIENPSGYFRIALFNHLYHYRIKELK